MAFGGVGLSSFIAAQEIEQAITAVDAAESGLQARPPANEGDPSELLAEPTEAVANPEPAEEQAGNTEKTEAAIPASPYAVQIADWVVATGDSHGKPFIVIDKVTAEVLAYDAEGQLQGVTPALLGIAHGDDSTPGIGQRQLSQMGPPATNGYYGSISRPRSRCTRWLPGTRRSGGCNGCSRRRPATTALLSAASMCRRPFSGM
jgi:hypothetical protein